MDRKEKALNRRRARLLAFAATIDVPSTPRTGETSEERGLRLIEATIKRIELSDASGVFPMRERREFEYLRQTLIARRTGARREVKIQRGDY